MKAQRYFYQRFFLSVCLLALSLVGTGSLHAAPMMSLGDSADLFINGSTAIRWDDNLALDENNELDDFVFQLKPGLELVFGNGETAGNFSILYQYDILRYSSEDAFDTENNILVANGSYEGAKFTGTANFAFIESETNTSSINLPGQLIPQEVTTLNLNGEYEISPKTSVGVGIQYVDTSYVGFATNLIPDRDTLSIPVDVYFASSPKLALSAGYRYRTTDIERGNDPDDHFFNVGVRGEMTPKLNGQIRVGYQSRNYSVGSRDDENALSVVGDMVWEATPKTQVSVRLNRDFNVGGAGETLRNTGFMANAQYAYSEIWYFTGNFWFDRNEYVGTTREDDMVGLGVGLVYVPNDYVRVTSGLSFKDNDSNNPGSSYSQSQLSVSASLRY